MLERVLQHAHGTRTLQCMHYGNKNGPNAQYITLQGSQHGVAREDEGGPNAQYITLQGSLHGVAREDEGPPRAVASEYPHQGGAETLKEEEQAKVTDAGNVFQRGTAEGMKHFGQKEELDNKCQGKCYTNEGE